MDEIIKIGEKLENEFPVRRCFVCNGSIDMREESNDRFYRFNLKGFEVEETRENLNLWFHQDSVRHDILQVSRYFPRKLTFEEKLTIKGYSPMDHNSIELCLMPPKEGHVIPKECVDEFAGVDEQGNWEHGFSPDQEQEICKVCGHTFKEIDDDIAKRDLEDAKEYDINCFVPSHAQEYAAALLTGSEFNR